MSEIIRDYYERFKALPETLRLLIVVSALGICCLYVLGIVSLVAAPRLRQAPVAYAEAVLLTPTPTDTATPEPSATPTATPEPTFTPTVALTVVDTPAVPTIEATPTQRSLAPSATPTEPRVEPTPTRKPQMVPTTKPHAVPTATVPAHKPTRTGH